MMPISICVVIIAKCLFFSGIECLIVRSSTPGSLDTESTKTILSEDVPEITSCRDISNEDPGGTCQSTEESSRTIDSSMLLVYCQFCQATCGFNSPNIVKSNTNEINDFIYGLKYSRDEVLAYRKGEKIRAQMTRNGSLNEKRDFIVITRTKRSTENRNSDIAAVMANEHRIFPGALLLANERLVDNTPDVLAVNRAPLTYTINLPGLTEGGSFTIVPSFANYKSAKEKALNLYFENNPTSNNFIANFESELSFAYSKELLRVKFGLGFANSKLEAGIDYRQMESGEKMIVIYKFKQVFYTVSVESTKKPSDQFGSCVTVEDLKRKTDNSNPPVMVDSVSYGRVIYIKVETSSTDRQAKFILGDKLPLYFTSGQYGTDLQNSLSNLDFQVFVMGGGADHINLIKANSLKDVTDIIAQYGKLSKSNLGYPISSSAEFIKDNSRAVVLMSTDYYETTRTVHRKGIIKLKHTGWYVMKWRISWRLVNYDEDGTKRVERVSWGGNDEHRTSPFERELELPGNAEDISVYAEEQTGLAWEGWRTVIDRSGIDLVGYRTFWVWGTTLNPGYTIE